MATALIPAPKVGDASIGSKFERYVAEWKSTRSPSSSVEKLAMHPAYQRIIGLGPEALPLILRELSDKPAHWFWALRSITGENPVKEEHRGDLRLMAEDWFEWARFQGIAW